MEKKIEKMGHFLVPSSTSEGVVDALRSLADKLNEIIDHLNSQAQPEEKVEDYFGAEDIYGKGRVDLYEKPLKARTQLIKKALDKIKDTPEEWEEEFRRKFWLFDVDKDNNPSVVNMRVIEYVRQLLDEREREVLERLLEKR